MQPPSVLSVGNACLLLRSSAGPQRLCVLQRPDESPVWLLLKSREIGRRQETTEDPFVDRPVLFTIRPCLDPFRIKEERIPFLLAIC